MIIRTVFNKSMIKKFSVYEPSHTYVIACVDVIVQNTQGDILLTKRAKQPFHGSWIIPGGHLKAGEEPSDAAIREVYEETGFLIHVERLYGVYATPGVILGSKLSRLFLSQP